MEWNGLLQGYRYELKYINSQELIRVGFYRCLSINFRWFFQIDKYDYNVRICALVTLWLLSGGSWRQIFEIFCNNRKNRLRTRISIKSKTFQNQIRTRKKCSLFPFPNAKKKSERLRKMTSSWSAKDNEGLCIFTNVWSTCLFIWIKCRLKWKVNGNVYTC